MANESKKNFNAMLQDSKDMPKIQTVTDPKTIEKYGGTRIYFAPPVDYDKAMRQVPYGQVITVGSTLHGLAVRILLSRLPQGFLCPLRHGPVTSGTTTIRPTGER